MKLFVLIFSVLTLLSACAPNAPCLKGHNEQYTYMQCYSYGKYGCTLQMPVTGTNWVCDQYGTPYPSGDPRR